MDVRALAVLASCFASHAAAQCASAPATNAAAVHSNGGGFAPNLGQWPDHVLAHTQRPGVEAWLDAHGWTLALRDGAAAWCLRLDWRAASVHSASHVAPLEERPCSRARFSGANPDAWRTSMFDYGRIALREVAPGLDVVARADAQTLEFDLEVAADAQESELVFSWSGHCGLALDESGALRVETGLGALVLPRPVAAVHGSDGAQPIECDYELLDDSSFRLRARRAGLAGALWIDPALRWSTYIGGQADQTIRSLAVAADGSVYVAGHTLAADYPTVLGAYQVLYTGGAEAFVSRLSADGSQLLASTFLAGAGDEGIVGLGLDPNGAVVVAGDTTSSDFPTSAGSFDTVFGGVSDIFAARLSADLASLEWSSFLGGSARDAAGSAVVRADGGVVVVGATRGAGFPTTAGAYDTSYNGGSFAGDAFALEFDPSGASLRWSTFLGGGGEESAERVTLDPSGSVSLAGYAYSPGFPTTIGAFDRSFDGAEEPFVARLSSNGQSLLFASFFGGARTDTIEALLTRSDGALLIGGSTDDASRPTTGGAFDVELRGPTEGYLAVLAPNAAALEFATFLGGGEEDVVTALAFDGLGQLIVALQTRSSDMPTTLGAFASQIAASAAGVEPDAFFLRCRPDMSAFDYATYFGGRNVELVRALHADANGELVFAGETRGAGFPTTPGAYRTSYIVAPAVEGFVSRLALLLHPISYGTPKLNSSGGYATIGWTGFPSVADAQFGVGIDLALSNVWCTVFSGLHPADTPFAGGRLRVRPPFTRYPRFKSDFLGYGMRAIPLAPWMAGQQVYFQVWYQDALDAFGCGLTDALRVQVYP